jgi:hypothetical protein
MFKQPAIAITIALASGLAFAQSATCTTLMEQYTSNMKDVSFGLFGAPTDNSAPREGNRLARAQVYMMAAHANLDLMIAAKCKLPDAPVNPDAYQKDSFKCGTATTNEDIEKACNRSGWTPKK